MQNSDVHLWSVFAINIGVINLFENIDPLLDFPENCVFSCQRSDIGFSESDEKLAIIEIGSWIRSCYQTNFIDLHLHINLIFEIRHVKASLLPDSSGFLRANLCGIIWMRVDILFWTSKKSELL